MPFKQSARDRYPTGSLSSSSKDSIRNEMAKKNFEGEGNPVEPGPGVLDVAEVTGRVLIVKGPPAATTAGSTVAADERAVLKKVLDRDRTSKQVHGGLKSLLGLTDDETAALLRFLNRI